jgi:hypothetical protein
MSEEPSSEPPNDEAAPTPLWVKLFGGVALAIVLLFVILLVVGGGHGPGRHGLPAVPAYAEQ